MERAKTGEGSYSLPQIVLIAPIPTPPPMPVSKDSRTHGYMCTCLRSPIRIVLIASARFGLSGRPPAVFWPEPSGNEFAFAGNTS